MHFRAWLAADENYVWEALQGALVQTELLQRAGYDVYHASDNALLRAYSWLFDVCHYPPSGDDTWRPWLFNHAYGTHFPTTPARTGKNMGFTDWLYGR